MDDVTRWRERMVASNLKLERLISNLNTTKIPQLINNLSSRQSIEIVSSDSDDSSDSDQDSSEDSSSDYDSPEELSWNPEQCSILVRRKKNPGFTPSEIEEIRKEELEKEAERTPPPPPPSTSSFSALPTTASPSSTTSIPAVEETKTDQKSIPDTVAPSSSSSSSSSSLLGPSIPCSPPPGSWAEFFYRKKFKRRDEKHQDPDYNCSDQEDDEEEEEEEEAEKIDKEAKSLTNYWNYGDSDSNSDSDDSDDDFYVSADLEAGKKAQELLQPSGGEASSECMEKLVKELKETLAEKARMRKVFTKVMTIFEELGEKKEQKGDSSTCTPCIQLKDLIQKALVNPKNRDIAIEFGLDKKAQIASVLPEEFTTLSGLFERYLLTANNTLRGARSLRKSQLFSHQEERICKLMQLTTRWSAELASMDLVDLRNLVCKKTKELREAQKKLGEQEDEIFTLRKENEKLKSYLKAATRTDSAAATSSSSNISLSIDTSPSSPEDLEERLRSQEALIASLRVRLAQKEQKEQEPKKVDNEQAEAPGEADKMSVAEEEQSEEGLIAAIRKEMGVGLAASPEVMRCFQEVRSCLERAIFKLSEDIYSNSSSFAMELLQNADDNEYPPTRSPSAQLVITPTLVVFSNNEKGFSPANVRAICNIGGSTKQSSEFIGHKGIGFKSVFKISDTPMVFSRNFRFGFDVLKERLGYIIPHWISDSELLAIDSSSSYSSPLLSYYPSSFSYIQSLLKQRPEDTHFVLPLKNGSEFDPQELFERVDHVLLFLRKIKELSVVFQKEEMVLRKSIIVTWPEGSDLRTIQVQVWEGEQLVRSSTSNFLIHRQVLEVPASLQGDNGRGRTTEIVLGFPQHLTATEKAAQSEEKGSKEDTEEEEPCFVYSYLPVRSYGFPFLIQADFLLVSNRQDIHKSKTWNKWLRDQIPVVFYEAIQSRKRKKSDRKVDKDEMDVQELDQEDLPARLIHFLPKKDKVTDPFWQPLVQEMKKLFINDSCLMTVSGNWRKPSDVLLSSPTDESGNSFLSAKDLSSIAKEFVHPSFVCLAQTVGCREFSMVDMVHILHRIDLKTKPIEWFCCLFNWLSSRSEDDLRMLIAPMHDADFLVSLRHYGNCDNKSFQFTSLPIFPLQRLSESKELQVCSLRQGTIFCVSEYILTDQCSSRWLNFLHSQVLKAVHSNFDFLKCLDVQYASYFRVVKEIVDYHIANFQTLQQVTDEIVEIVKEQWNYLYQHWRGCSSQFRDLQLFFLLPTNQGLLPANQVYFPSAVEFFGEDATDVAYLDKRVFDEHDIKPEWKKKRVRKGKEPEAEEGRNMELDDASTRGDEDDEDSYDNDENSERKESLEERRERGAEEEKQRKEEAQLELTRQEKKKDEKEVLAKLGVNKQPRCFRNLGTYDEVLSPEFSSLLSRLRSSEGGVISVISFFNKNWSVYSSSPSVDKYLRNLPKAYTINNKSYSIKNSYVIPPFYQDVKDLIQDSSLIVFPIEVCEDLQKVVGLKAVDNTTMVHVAQITKSTDSNIWTRLYTKLKFISHNDQHLLKKVFVPLPTPSFVPRKETRGTGDSEIATYLGFTILSNYWPLEIANVLADSHQITVTDYITGIRRICLGEVANGPRKKRKNLRLSSEVAKDSEILNKFYEGLDSRLPPVFGNSGLCYLLQNYRTAFFSNLKECFYADQTSEESLALESTFSHSGVNFIHPMVISKPNLKQHVLRKGVKEISTVVKRFPSAPKARLSEELSLMYRACILHFLQTAAAQDKEDYRKTKGKEKENERLLQLATELLVFKNPLRTQSVSVQVILPQRKTQLTSLRAWFYEESRQILIVTCQVSSRFSDPYFSLDALADLLGGCSKDVVARMFSPKIVEALTSEIGQEYSTFPMDEEAARFIDFTDEIKRLSGTDSVAVANNRESNPSAHISSQNQSRNTSSPDDNRRRGRWQPVGYNINYRTQSSSSSSSASSAYRSSQYSPNSQYSPHSIQTSQSPSHSLQDLYNSPQTPYRSPHLSQRNQSYQQQDMYPSPSFQWNQSYQQPSPQAMYPPSPSSSLSTISGSRKNSMETVSRLVRQYLTAGERSSSSSSSSTSSSISSFNTPVRPSIGEDFRERREASGSFAELVVYKLLEEEFANSSTSSSSESSSPSFGPLNWVSSNRMEYFPQEISGIDDSLGYDFFFFTKEGKKKKFEVKATLTDCSNNENGGKWSANGFYISANQWETAQKEGDAFEIIHVIIRPQLKIYRYPNPVELLRQGVLERTPVEWRVVPTSNALLGNFSWKLDQSISAGSFNSLAVSVHNSTAASPTPSATRFETPKRGMEEEEAKENARKKPRLDGTS